MFTACHAFAGHGSSCSHLRDAVAGPNSSCSAPPRVVPTQARCYQKTLFKFTWLPLWSLVATNLIQPLCCAALLSLSLCSAVAKASASTRTLVSAETREQDIASILEQQQPKWRAQRQATGFKETVRGIFGEPVCTSPRLGNLMEATQHLLVSYRRELPPRRPFPKVQAKWRATVTITSEDVVRRCAMMTKCVAYLTVS